MVRTLIQRRLRRTIRLCLALSCMGVSGANADWQVEFPAVKDGRPCHSIAFPSEDGLMLVAVVLSGADATRPEVKSDGVVIPVKMLGHDPVSRLCFFRPDPAVGLGRIVWEAKAPMASGFEMMSGSQRAPTSGWVKQVGTKVLPLALLRVNFDGSVPPQAARSCPPADRQWRWFFSKWREATLLMHCQWRRSSGCGETF